MNLWSVGLDFRTAELELRGRAAAKDSSLYEILAKEATEALWISTCNRVEFFAVSIHSPEELISAWIRNAKLDDEARDHFLIYRNDACLNHLFRVTASLESMVVGETQITSQVKRAYDEATHARRIGAILHRCCQRAFKVAKRVRSQTEVGRLAVSIPSIGVKLAEKVLGDLTQTKVGMIGLGEIGRVAAEHFFTVQPKKLMLYNRTEAVARQLATSLSTDQTRAEAFSSIDPLVENCDILVNGVDAPLFERRHLEVWQNRSGPLLILDLAVPPQIPLMDLSNHYIYRVDDLKKIAEENSRLRAQELEKAEQIIREETASCWRSLQSIHVGEILGEVQARADQWTASEIQELKARLPHLNAADWNEIEKMAKRLSSKVLQDPMVGLRSSLQEGEETETLVQFFRSIFRV